MANRRFGYRKNRKADMGIGTMIIFIAMVIVAAVAATLLISTASLVQQQAQHTGEVALADVSTGFQVVNIQGDQGNPVSGAIQSIDMKLELQAGSPDINMTQVVIEITDMNVDATLDFDATTADATHYTVENLRDPTGTYSATAPIVSGGGLIKVHIDSHSLGMDLGTQSHVEIKIIPKHGVPTFETFDTPAVYATEFITLY